MYITPYAKINPIAKKIKEPKTMGSHIKLIMMAYAMYKMIYFQFYTSKLLYMSNMCNIQKRKFVLRFRVIIVEWK